MTKGAVVALLALTLGPVRTIAGGASDGARVLAQATADFDGDGRIDRLVIQVRNGRRVNDTQPWCGAGRKDQGTFRVRLTLATGRSVETVLNSLYPPGTEPWFWAAPWTIELQDYDRDGRIEFNLGQYESCNNWRYAIFRVERSGIVTRVAVEPDGTIPVEAHDNSTRRIARTPTGIRAVWYDNSRSHMQRDYRWDASRQAFVMASEQLMK